MPPVRMRARTSLLVAVALAGFVAFGACGDPGAASDAGVGGPIDVASITPDHASATISAAVTIHGHGFASGGDTVVVIGTEAATDVEVIDDATITARSPIGTPAATVDVVVATGDGYARLIDGFQFNPRPTITAIRPPAGAAAGGTDVTIVGTGFQAREAGVTLIAFDGLAANAVTIVSDSLATARTPPGAPFTAADVTLANANGDARAAGLFRYTGHGLVFGGPRGGTPGAIYFFDPATTSSTKIMDFTTGVAATSALHALATIGPGHYWAVTRGGAAQPHLLELDLMARAVTDVGPLTRVTDGLPLECNDLELVDGTLLCVEHGATFRIDPLTATATKLASQDERVFGVAEVGGVAYALSVVCCARIQLHPFTLATGALGTPVTVTAGGGSGGAPGLGKLTALDGQLYAIDNSAGGFGGVPGGIGGGRAVYRIDPITAFVSYVGSLPVRAIALTRSE